MLKLTIAWFNKLLKKLIKILTQVYGYGSLDVLPLTNAVKAFGSAFSAAPPYAPKILGTHSSIDAMEFKYKSPNPIVVNSWRPSESHWFFEGNNEINWTLKCYLLLTYGPLEPINVDIKYT